MGMALTYSGMEIVTKGNSKKEKQMGKVSTPGLMDLYMWVSSKMA